MHCGNLARVRVLIKLKYPVFVTINIYFLVIVYQEMGVFFYLYAIKNKYLIFRYVSIQLLAVSSQFFQGYAGKKHA